MRRLVWAACTVGTLAMMPALAQVTAPPFVDSGAQQQRQIEEERRRREREQEQRKPTGEPLKREAPSGAAPAPSAAESVRFPVRQIRFTESAILAEGELSALAQPFLGRELSLADLRGLAEQVNGLYRQRGVVTAQAGIPPQDVSSGVVTIRLVEGRLGQVLVRGNETTDAGYVTARVGLQPDDLMDLGRLEDALIRFNRTNDAQLRAELKPGRRFSTTDVDIAMAEPPRHDLRVTADNLGADATGRNRLGLAYTNRSLLGFRDELGLADTRAAGQDSRSATYAFPVNTWGGRLSLGHYADRTAIKNGPLEPLRITGRATATVLSLRQPTWVDAGAQVDVVAGAKRRKNRNWIDQVFLSGTDIRDRSLGVEAQLFGASASWFGSFTRSAGHADTTQRDAFRIDRGSLRHFRDLGGGFSFRGVLSWQSTRHRNLSSGEQLFIGGEGTVRGYPVGQFAGDTGQVLNLELHHPLLAGEGGRWTATGFLFADGGRVAPFRPPNSTLPAREHLGSLGWGLNLQLGTRAFARLTIGHGQRRLPQMPRSNEVTLQIVASVF